MGLFGKSVKDSNHEGNCDRSSGEKTNSVRPYTSRVVSTGTPSLTSEEIDRAIALSLSENDNRDRASQFEEDELLARALQESMELRPQQDRGNQKVPDTKHENEKGSMNGTYIPAATGSRMCAGCNSVIGHGRFLSCVNSIWHPDCFKCYSCRLPIYESEFFQFPNLPYHKVCYKEAHHPKCDVCHQFIPKNAAGDIEYRVHPFWSQKYCPSHEKSSKCCICERMESMDMKFASLSDGRSPCFECLDSALMDTDECQPLYRELQEFYEGFNMKVNEKIPLLLVERQILDKSMNAEGSNHNQMPEVRGICLSEEQTVKAILHRPKSGNRINTEPYKLKRHCDVTAILVLYGLPRLLTGSIIAHEMMHAWMRLNGYRKVRPEVEEGMCQVMASMWLESQILNMSIDDNVSASRRSAFEEKLSVFLKHQIANDASVVYGQGFRSSNEAVSNFGLQKTLDQIKATGTLP